MLNALKKTLKRAGLPIVCIHSLRGTFMSIAAPRVGASQAFFNYVGHGDRGQTARKHYFTEEAKRDLSQQQMSASQRQASAGLFRGAPEQVDLPSTLAALSPEQLAQVLPLEVVQRLVEHLGSRSSPVSGGFPPVHEPGVSDGKKDRKY